MRLKTHYGEDHHQSTEDENSPCQIPQKQPCALSCKSQCSEPIKADNRPDNEDDPVGVGSACDVKRRLHQPQVDVAELGRHKTQLDNRLVLT